MRRVILPGEHVFTASAFLITNDATPPRALLHRHPKFNRWLQPGGHIEKLEDPVTALIREVKEEVGIDLEPYFGPHVAFSNVRILPLPAQVTSIYIHTGKFHPDDPMHYMVDLAYLVRVPYQPIKEGITAMWAGRLDLDDYDIPGDIRAFLYKHL